MNVVTESNYLKVLQVDTIDGNVCVAVPCRDYQHYTKLPDVVRYEGTLLGKTGWNSDRNQAYYQSRCHFVAIVK